MITVDIITNIYSFLPYNQRDACRSRLIVPSHEFMKIRAMSGKLTQVQFDRIRRCRKDIKITLENDHEVYHIVDGSGVVVGTPKWPISIEKAEALSACVMIRYYAIAIIMITLCSISAGLGSVTGEAKYYIMFGGLITTGLVSGLIPFCMPLIKYLIYKP